jgi:hypothetical protein
MTAATYVRSKRRARHLMAGAAMSYDYSTMGRHLVVWLLCVLSFGCAAKPPVWRHPTASHDQIARDRYECTREATYTRTAAWGMLMDTWQEVSPLRFGLCMEARGYRRDGEAAAAPLKAQPGIGGTYAGRATGMQGTQRFSMPVTFTIARSGVDVVGAWTSTEGASGTLAMHVIEERMLDLRAKQLNPCIGEFIGRAIVEDDGRQLRGAYKGNGCGQPVEAEFIVNKQQ